MFRSYPLPPPSPTFEVIHHFNSVYLIRRSIRYCNKLHKNYDGITVMVIKHHSITFYDDI